MLQGRAMQRGEVDHPGTYSLVGFGSGTSCDEVAWAVAECPGLSLLSWFFSSCPMGDTLRGILSRAEWKKKNKGLAFPCHEKPEPSRIKMHGVKGLLPGPSILFVCGFPHSWIYQIKLPQIVARLPGYVDSLACLSLLLLKSSLRLSSFSYEALPIRQSARCSWGISGIRDIHRQMHCSALSEISKYWITEQYQNREDFVSYHSTMIMMDFQSTLL